MVERTISASPESVWARYTDHLSWQDWAGLGRVRLDKEGVPSPNGVGCVRVIGSFGVSVFEEVTEFKVPEKMSYRVVKGGLPIKDHLGEVFFRPNGTATLVTWRCRFRSKIPGLGWLFRLIILKVFRDTLEGL
ncbi:MAG: SRPBCC family protein, partial [Candidatus Binatia bacterium]